MPVVGKDEPTGKMSPDMRARPTASVAVTATPLDDEVVLYDTRVNEVYVLNSTGGRVWNLCDGSRTMVSVARAIAEEYGIPYGTAIGDVTNLVRQLESAGLLAAE